MGEFAGDCIKAALFGLKDYGIIIILMIVFGLVAMVAGVVLLPFGAALSQSTGGRLVFVLLALAFQMTLGGYFARYYLDVVKVTTEGSDAGPTPPAWNVGEMLRTGLQWLALCLVYVGPIVTLPLLPLGVLALARTNDGRAFNAAWAFRAAARRTTELILLWLILLLWLVLTAPIVILLIVLTGGPAAAATAGGSAVAGFAVGLMATLLVSAVVFMVAAICFRCIGLLGYHWPELTQTLPAAPNGMVSLGCVGAGLALTIAAHAIIGGTFPPTPTGPPVVTVRDRAPSGALRDPVAIGGTQTPTTTKAPADLPEPIPTHPPTPTPGPTPAATPASSPQAEKDLKRFYALAVGYAKAHGGRFPASPRDVGVEVGSLVCAVGKTTASPAGHVLAYDPTIRQDRPAGGQVLAVHVDGSVVGHPSILAVEELLSKQHTPDDRPRRTEAATTQPSETPRSDPNDDPVKPPAAMKWRVAWPDLDAGSKHAFRDYCRWVKKIRPKTAADIAGLNVGPAAGKKTDDAYVRFAKETAEQFDAMIAGIRNTGTKRTASQKWGDVEYERTNAYRGTLQVTVLIGIEKGRCVAYWFVGTNNCFMTQFVKGLGRFDPGED